MRKFFVSAGMMLALSVSVSAQENGAPTVASDHKPNEHTLACLENLNRDCALSAAIQTAISEELGLEKAKVLTGVGQAMLSVGDKTRAQRTLMLALEEARSVGLALVVQERIRTIAPLLAKSGDIASALSLVEEIQIDRVRDQILQQIAEAAIEEGDLASAQVAVDQIKNKRVAFWRELELYLKAPTNVLAAVDLIPFVEGIEKEPRADFQYRGLVTLALIERRRGYSDREASLLAGADALLDKVLSRQLTAEMMSLKLRAFYAAGFRGDMLASLMDGVVENSRQLRNDALVAIAGRVGPIQAAEGRSTAALEWMRVFEDSLEDKARYLARLKFDAPNTAHSELVEALLQETRAVDGAYDRDNLRLSLLEAAIGAKNINLARQVVSQIEDDDNQALGLAQLIVLL